MPPKTFRIIKPEIRVLGVDDGPFTLHYGYAPIIGVVFRGGYWLDGVMSTRIKVDGFDATSKIASMIMSSPHLCQVRAILLDGITFGGFNVVDIKKLNAITSLPIIVVTRKKPNFDEIHAAVKNLPRTAERWKAVQNAGALFEVQTRSGDQKVYMEICGIREADATRIVQLTSTRSSIPEALRVAHLIVSGASMSLRNTIINTKKFKRDSAKAKETNKQEENPWNSVQNAAPDSSLRREKAKQKEHSFSPVENAATRGQRQAERLNRK